MKATRRNALAVVLAAGLTLSTMSAAQEPVAVGDDFQVNTYTTGFQDEVSVATDPEGNFVVVWETSTGDDERVRGARFASDGSPIGDEFIVTEATTGFSGSNPRAAYGPDGFIVVWSAEDGGFDEVMARRFSSDGTPIGSQFQVNSYTTADQDYPNVAFDSSGAFVVVWESYFSPGGVDLRGQMFGSDGAPVGDEFQLNTYTTNNQFEPAPAFLDQSGGGFVVVWFGDPNYTIQGRRFQSTGAPLGAQFQVDDDPSGIQLFPSVASLLNGDFVVAWEDGSSVGDDPDASVQARRFASDAFPLGSQFQVNVLTTGVQERASVSASAFGDFIIAWDGRGEADTTAIRGRFYDSSGAPRGGEFQVNSYTTESQAAPVVAVDAAGDFTVAWSSGGSAGTDSAESSIQSRRFRGSGDLGDFVWFDKNVNGIQDGSEMGLGGATAELLDVSDQVIASTVSTGDGSYLFPKVPPGDYTVRVVAPQGYLFTDQDAGSDDAADSDVDAFGRSDVFTILPGVPDFDVDVGLRYPKIGDYVWLDLDGSGIQDGAESGVSGVTVTLFDASDAQINQTTTSADGEYAIYAPDGDYYLVFTAPTDHAWTARDAGFDDSVDSDVSAFGSTIVFSILSADQTQWDAGLVPAPVVIGDRVWLDTDLDGLQDGGEFGVSGVSVKLFDAAGVAIDSTLTGSDGSYAFSGVASGTYYLSFTPPADHCFTAPDQGPDDDLDSDVDPESYTTLLFTYDGVSADLSRDAGLVPEASVGNRVWSDDGNGVQDGGEPGVSGVTVRLYEADGTLADQTTTSGEGLYSFSPGPGDYYLEFVLPADTAFAPRDQGADDALDSDANAGSGTTSVFTLSPGTVEAGWDAGLEPAAIGNFVWDDADGDGRQSPTESGVSGVTVRLLDAGGVEVDSTTTDADGIYQFIGVASGTYRVEVVAPVDKIFSPQSVGGNGLIDSDVNPSNGRTELFAYEAGSAGRFYDAGLQDGVTVSLPFIDGFESGDTSAWSRVVP